MCEKPTHMKLLWYEKMLLMDTLYLSYSTRTKQMLIDLHKYKKLQEIRKNVGAKVLSARITQALNFSTTPLTTGLCNAREHVAKSGENWQRPTIR